ncbi:MAG: hypothetical protein ACFCVE_06330 [Phycisphaerae bacterium]
MPNSYAAFCDDFYVNMRLCTAMPLPRDRGAVLHFYEQLQKAYPGMSHFRRTEAEASIEEDRSQDHYRWVGVEAQRLAAGHVNPESVAEALKLHKLVLDLAPHNLGLSPVEIEYLDVLFGFDLEYQGNHDEVVVEGLLSESPLGSLLEEAGARATDVQPSLAVALSEDCRLQARLEIVTRTSAYQVRTGDYNEEAISVYLIVRQYWGLRPAQPLTTLVQSLADRADDLASRYVVPRVVQPLSAAIASRG